MNMKFKNFRKSAELFGAMCGGLLITLPAIPQAVAQQSVTQQSTPKINPCPRIFYEEPHNSRVVVPQGCPANALTQRLAAQGLLPANPSQEQTRLGVGGETPQGTPSSTVNPNPSIGNQPQNTVQPDGSTQPSTSSEPGVSPATVVPGEQNITPGSRNTSTTPIPLPSQQQAPNATIALANGRVNIRLVNDTATNVTYQVIGDTAPRSLSGKSDVTLQSLSAPVTVTFQREDGGQLTVTPQISSEAGSLEVRFNEATDVAQGRSTMRIEQNGSLFLN
ncbi:hypothetical protein [Nostoc sp. UHCC 0251]|uniref:hypothetical protein n=1 Tax=Nostoc sp. UHCC 0251 TaxID=3110240 RepID=UPI002B20975F|nr:hypothetical protein [Nostoc sp. UHCC 0251]MEA5622737.1 hypothetical protein [Nostoc sp. UHCC 0251]